MINRIPVLVTEYDIKIMQAVKLWSRYTDIYTLCQHFQRLRNRFGLIWEIQRESNKLGFTNSLFGDCFKIRVYEPWSATIGPLYEPWSATIVGNHGWQLWSATIGPLYEQWSATIVRLRPNKFKQASSSYIRLASSSYIRLARSISSHSKPTSCCLARRFSTLDHELQILIKLFCEMRWEV